MGENPVTEQAAVTNPRTGQHVDSQRSVLSLGMEDLPAIPTASSDPPSDLVTWPNLTAKSTDGGPGLYGEASTEASAGHERMIRADPPWVDTEGKYFPAKRPRSNTEKLTRQIGRSRNLTTVGLDLRDKDGRQGNQRSSGSINFLNVLGRPA
ncbi:hypothetical protein C1H76_0880 [Elsinoe australis]|uniref:Uncharacterized protein n=1 Tax=Elsinoe australis TaxID=40998 RepID=A0A4U7BCR2_9PEZI|nr:hypothetical protein C1H76_0880 [Elsinoe australis]